MPLQFEWRGQRIDPLFNVRAKWTAGFDRNFCRPPTVFPLAPDDFIVCSNVDVAWTAKDLAQSFQNESSIIAPLVPIIGSDKAGDGGPIPFLDLRNKVCAMQLDLAMGLPESREISSKKDCEKNAGVKTVSEIGTHRTNRNTWGRHRYPQMRKTRLCRARSYKALRHPKGTGIYPGFRLTPPVGGGMKRADNLLLLLCSPLVPSRLPFSPF